MKNKSLRSDENGFLQVFAMIIFALVILTGFAILVLIGALVFKTSIMLGAVLVFGIVLSFVGPWIWVKFIGGLMTIGAVIATLIMLL
jgi:hypothetical protein